MNGNQPAFTTRNDSLFQEFRRDREVTVRLEFMAASGPNMVKREDHPASGDRRKEPPGARQRSHLQARPNQEMFGGASCRRSQRDGHHTKHFLNMNVGGFRRKESQRLVGRIERLIYLGARAWRPISAVPLAKQRSVGNAVREQRQFQNSGEWIVPRKGCKSQLLTKRLEVGSDTQLATEKKLRADDDILRQMDPSVTGLRR